MIQFMGIYTLSLETFFNSKVISLIGFESSVCSLSPIQSSQGFEKNSDNNLKDYFLSYLHDRHKENIPVAQHPGLGRMAL